ncbi:MAG: DNA-binding protein WhiA [Defluviitaleaceae bacterium]|nr:DNA-binding protein WhiA [Defluviitaleaceae bacterium]
MSFSFEVKKELCSKNEAPRHCNIAEICAIINTCGTISFTESGAFIKIQTESASVAKRYFMLIKNNFNVSGSLSSAKSLKFKKNRQYSVLIDDEAAAGKILNAAGILDSNSKSTNLNKGVNALVVKSTCCKRAYIRGAFISGGSVTTPEKGYHIEFVNHDADLSAALSLIINSFGLNSKVTVRKSYYVTYIKDVDNIIDLINVMDAPISLMNFENARILKDMRNNVNRRVNCETANINKTVDAALKQIDDIKYIFEQKKQEHLSDQLLEIAELRLKNPESSLKELGNMLTRPVGKSGVNHRLRKLSEIADDLRAGGQ